MHRFGGMIRQRHGQRKILHSFIICLLGVTISFVIMNARYHHSLVTSFFHQDTHYALKHGNYYYYYQYYIYNNTMAASPILEPTTTATTTIEQDFAHPDIFPNMTQDRIDLAVIGFAKCGTMVLLRGILGGSSDVYMGDKDSRGNYREMHHMAFGHLSEFLSYFPSHRPNPSLQQGFKDPIALLWEPSLYHISTYFPKAKLIATVRHPIPWFESLYNYMMIKDERYWSDLNITPHNRIGECSRQMSQPLSKYSTCKSNQTCISYKPGFGCTDWANYHVHLSRLGWTSRNSTRELSLLDHRLVNTFNFNQTKLFLMESNQLDAKKYKTHTITLIEDLESFLEMKYGSLPRSYENKTIFLVDKSKVKEETILKRLISICDDEYHDLRKLLLKQAMYVM